MGKRGPTSSSGDLILNICHWDNWGLQSKFLTSYKSNSTSLTIEELGAKMA